jgi:hypothetical protein
LSFSAKLRIESLLYAYYILHFNNAESTEKSISVLACGKAAAITGIISRKTEEAKPSV